MVNLIAERQIVPELIQHDMTAPNIVGAAEQLLTNRAKRIACGRTLRACERCSHPKEILWTARGEIISDSLQTKMGDHMSWTLSGENRVMLLGSLKWIVLPLAAVVCLRANEAHSDRCSEIYDRCGYQPENASDHCHRQD